MSLFLCSIFAGESETLLFHKRPIMNVLFKTHYNILLLYVLCLLNSIATKNRTLMVLDVEFSFSFLLL